MNIQEVHHFLKQHQISPSVHRSAIMHYLFEHHHHPTADQIYTDLLASMPTLSKATVYNTLKLLVERKAVNTLFIDEKNVRYQADTKLHAHFKCKNCGDIYDIPLDESDTPKFRGNPDLSTTETQVYFLGICKKCVK